MASRHDLASLPLPAARERLGWRGLPGVAQPLALALAAARASAPLVVLAADARGAERLEEELAFFGGPQLAVQHFPDWETLPFDRFSPHQDIISRRLETLYRLPEMTRGLVVVPINTALQRLPPPDYVRGRSLLLERGQRLDLQRMRRDLEASGYQHVAQVMEHGEFSVRGGLIDLFPMGSAEPYRIDLFDDEIESIRRFDPQTQLSADTLESVRLLPAREFPLDEAGIRAFRQRWRARFEGNPQDSLTYRDVSDGVAPGGVESYLPLFFEQTATLFDYLPADCLIVRVPGLGAALHATWEEIQTRYDQRQGDRERPLLTPAEAFLDPAQMEARLAAHAQLDLDDAGEPLRDADVAAPPPLLLNTRASEPAAAVHDYVQARQRHGGRTLFAAESAGRREALGDILRRLGLAARTYAGWQDFLDDTTPVGLTVAPLEAGLVLDDVAIVSEPQLYGERTRTRQRRRPTRDPASIIRDLTDLAEGAPVVHEEYGVGRYRGLVRLTAGGQDGEFLLLEYADRDKLYVPVGSLHLISRYTGTEPEHAPLHRLGGEQWDKARRRAARKARDAAAELLDVIARRQAAERPPMAVDLADERDFAAAFPFEETPDQLQAIEAVRQDLAAPYPMDRVVCGDVGFGKTEVAMRAAFLAVQSGRQVALLVPTTLLAQQHVQNFSDRFADWPVRIESISRMRGRKQQQAVLEATAEGKVDILIGTHRLLQSDVRFAQLGLVIIDEEHRFGVRHKERLKQLRASIDVLTLTATPIPRTLNMSLAGLRDLSIIATPPVERLAVRTFVSMRENGLIQEACLREIKRGGQVYFLHNKVETIERTAEELRRLLPQARVLVAHGQMPERELERVMLDFYHRRANVLVCTTIIESGIDVASANTILIDRADHLGLAQLHQLRGRVGRSHHRAYCYLLAPPREALSADAEKRLAAIEALGELGSGFTLATHDMEIRGAGELLGDDQSGQIQEVGFALYNDLLERAVASLKKGEMPAEDLTPQHGAEVDLGLPALLPEAYVPDVHLRLILYKRLASAASQAQLHDLQVEMIDRFGLLPEPAKRLVAATELKLLATRLGALKLNVGERAGKLVFGPRPTVSPEQLIALIQGAPKRYRLERQTALQFTLTAADEPGRLHEVHALLNRLLPQSAGEPVAAAS